MPSSPSWIPGQGTASDIVSRLASYIDPVEPQWSRRLRPASPQDLAPYLDVSGLTRAGLALPESYLQFVTRAGEDDGGLLESMRIRAKPSDLCEYYEDAVLVSPESLDVRLPAVAMQYVIGDEVFLDLREADRRTGEPRVCIPGPDVLAESFEKLLFRCAFTTCESARFSGYGELGGSRESMRDALLQGDQPLLELVRRAAQREGFARAWFSDSEHDYFYRSDLVFSSELASYSTLMICIYGQDAGSIETWGDHLGARIAGTSWSRHPSAGRASAP